MKSVVYIRADSIYCDSRATKEIMALLENGYRVTVLGWNRDGKAITECVREFPESDKLEFRFYERNIANGIGGIRNIGALIGWIVWTYKTLRSISQIEIVHACDLDSGLAAHYFCRLKKVKLVYDIFDYYIDAHSMHRILQPLVEKLEIAIINTANLTIICTEERSEQIKKANPQNVIVIHNSPNVQCIPNVDINFDFAYCGDMSKIRLVDKILDIYHQNDDLRFYYAGNGVVANEAVELDESFNNFTYGGKAVSYAEVIRKEASSLCLAAIYDPSYRNHRLCAPNKFYEALALGKPIIVCKGTGIDRIVIDNRIGIVINYDADEFYKAIRLLKDNPNLCVEMGNRARLLYEEKYTWKSMQNRLISAYETL